MKIIDSKGKLFGKVNLIDLIVVLVVLLVAGGVAWKLFGPSVTNAIGSISGTKMIQYEVVCPNVPENVVEYAKKQVGGQLMSNGDLVTAHITQVTAEPATTIVMDENGAPVSVINPEKFDMYFVVDATTVPTDDIYSVGSQEIRVGKAHIMKTVFLELNGQITTMEEVAAHE